MNEMLKNAERKISKEAFENLKKWLAEEEFASYKDEIESLIKAGSWEELEDAFYSHVRIGTGGIRGKIGVGPNRINLRTIGEAAQGLSQFIEDFGEEAKQKGVVVGHEVRKNSVEFARLTGSVLAANGIKTFLFDGIRSTPEISFAIRHLQTIAGVELTASHNPKTDNGFKFFWTYGGQVVPPLDQKFMELVLNVKEIKKLDFEEAKKSGMVKIIGKEVDEAYFQSIMALSLVKTRTAKIAFSPINSCATTNALPILRQEGFDVTVVPEQENPDENFPGAFGDFINPEYEEVIAPTTKLAEKIEADLAICADPDGCRIGATVKASNLSNKLVFLTPNELGSAMLYFILSTLKEEGKLQRENLFVKTHNTTNLASDIAESFGIKVEGELLVGFKWIGQVVENLKNKEDFIFAFEDTCGYVRGDYIRDKDAAVAALLLAEMASWLKDRKMTIVDYLKEIYQKYSYYRNITDQIDVEGKSGFEDVFNCMRAFREKPPKEIAGFKVLKTADRLDPEFRKADKYKPGMTGDQVTFFLSEDGKTKVMARPSGTQPQLKYAIQHQAKVDGDFEKTKKEVDSVAFSLEKAMYDYQDKVLGKKVPGHSFKSSW
jgi:phosphoglucomutase/phosphomannomutase